MGRVRIYHNPRCSKSRATLQLLESRGLEPEIIRYLDESPDVEALRKLTRALGVRPAAILRRGEGVFEELGLAERLDDDEALLQAMAENPILIERPIVVCGSRARIGRPPEKVLEIL